MTDNVSKEKTSTSMIFTEYNLEVSSSKDAHVQTHTCTKMELKTVWRNGHMETVLCLGLNVLNDVAASGAEKGEVCLWSLDGKVISKKTFPSLADVNSVRFSSAQPSILYVAVGQVIEMVDIRCPDNSMVTFTYNKEDINQLAVDPKDAFLAACDDDGVIKVIDVQNHKVFRTLKGHDNICSSVSFHPSVPREMVSGGLDCFIHTWEINRGKPLVSMNMQEVLLEVAAGDDETPSPYMINPPFVHSVDHSSSGNHIACGLENAQIQLLERKGRRNLLSARSLQGHSLGVTQVCFVPDCPGQTPDLLVSAGNDCRLILWDTSPKCCSSGDTGKTKTVAQRSETNSKSEIELTSECEGTSKDCSSSESSVLSKNQQRCSIKHTDKINWIAPLYSSGGTNLILVADVSQTVSVYQWQ